MTPADDDQQQSAGRERSGARRRRNRGGSRRSQSTDTAAKAVQPARPRDASKDSSHDTPAGRHNDATQPSSAGQHRDSGQQKDNGQQKDPDRNWRELAGAAPSQVGVSGAMRARDLNRPTPEDLAAAERDLVIIRRQWQPPEAQTNR